jgi:hypothetical protein
VKSFSATLNKSGVNMEADKVIWTPDKHEKLIALGYTYDADNNKWVKHEKHHDEFVRATADYLYWFDMQSYGDGDILNSNKFPIMDFDALIVFLRAIQFLKEKAE